MLEGIYELIEQGLNRYIRLDPEYRRHLPRFEGKVIHIHMTSPLFSLYLIGHADGFLVQQHYAADADARIQGTLIQFTRMLSAAESEKTAALFQKKIIIEGDISLGQQFQAYFQRLDVDWEEQLSQITGDVVAHQGFTLAGQFHTFVRKANHSVRQSVAEYLQYESEDLVDARDIEDLLQSIDRVRDDVDRLEARIKRLSAVNAPT